MSDNPEIQLQENIPLSDEDIKYIESEKKGFDKAWILAAVATLFTMVIMAFIKTQTDVFLSVVLIVFAASYLPIWFIQKQHKANFEKDKKYGKNKLTTVVLHSNEEDIGHFSLAFAGQSGALWLKVKDEDYHRYTVGTKVVVTYLKFSGKALEIVEIGGNRHAE